MWESVKQLMHIWLINTTRGCMGRVSNRLLQSISKKNSIQHPKRRGCSQFLQPASSSSPKPKPKSTAHPTPERRCLIYKTNCESEDHEHYLVRLPLLWSHSLEFQQRRITWFTKVIRSTDFEAKIQHLIIYFGTCEVSHSFMSLQARAGDQVVCGIKPTLQHTSTILYIS